MQNVASIPSLVLAVMAISCSTVKTGHELFRPSNSVDIASYRVSGDFLYFKDSIIYEIRSSHGLPVSNVTFATGQFDSTSSLIQFAGVVNERTYAFDLDTAQVFLCHLSRIASGPTAPRKVEYLAQFPIDSEGAFVGRIKIDRNAYLVVAKAGAGVELYHVGRIVER